MGEEEFLFTGKKMFRRSDNWPKRRCHLQANHDENEAQSFRWLRAEPLSNRPIASTRRKPKLIPIAHRMRCNAAMNATESVDWEKIHATGANPIKQQRAKTDSREQSTADGAQARIDSAKTGENVEAGQANQDRK